MAAPRRLPAGIDILKVIADPLLLGKGFKRPASWAAWRSFLAALFGLPMDEAMLATYRQCTGRQAPPPGGSTSAYLVCGRRSGKSFTLAAIAIFLATCRDWRPYLQAGERATIMIVATDRKQARAIFRFIAGMLQQSPVFKPLIEAQGQDYIELKKQVSIEIHTASTKTTRGYTIVAALLDELAHWPTDESTTPDTEIVAAIRPGMATIPGAMLLCASSPYMRKGVLWDAYRRYYGKEDAPAIVWQAATRVMNANITQAFIDEQIAERPEENTAEYMATFRSDLESFISREVVSACVDVGVYERTYQPNTSYIAGVDLSGGQIDSAALAIAHNEASRDTLVVDLIRERKAPHSPENVIQEFSQTMKAWNVHKVKGDRYAGQFPIEQFAKFGITFEPSERNRSEVYHDLLPLLNSGRVSLLDDLTCFNQLCSLERRTSRYANKEAISHPEGRHFHDDVINAVAMAVVNAASPYGSYDPFFGCGRDPTKENEVEAARAFRMASFISHVQRFG